MSTPLSRSFWPTPQSLNSLLAYSSTLMPSSDATVTTAISG